MPSDDDAILTLDHMGDYDAALSIRIDADGTLNVQRSGYHTGTTRERRLTPDEIDQLLDLAAGLPTGGEVVEPEERAPRWQWHLRWQRDGVVQSCVAYDPLEDDFQNIRSLADRAEAWIDPEDDRFAL
jgi:hypothetical protein